MSGGRPSIKLQAELILAAIAQCEDARDIAQRHGGDLSQVEAWARNISARGDKNPSLLSDQPTVNQAVAQLGRKIDRLSKSVRLMVTLTHPIGLSELPLLVTGCARSGTRFVTAVLRASGRAVEQEVPAVDGTVSWIHAPAPFRRSQGLRFERIIHQHRHPLRVIASAATLSERSWSHIIQYAPDCATGDLLTRSAKYWVLWNELAEREASFSYSIESLSDPACLAAFALASDTAVTQAALNVPDREINSRADYPGYRSLAWGELKQALSKDWFARLHALASRYGYDVPDQ